jgi:hypothetical protein
MHGKQPFLMHITGRCSNCRTAKPRERAYKLFDGGGMYLSSNSTA